MPLLQPYMVLGRKWCYFDYYQERAGRKPAINVRTEFGFTAPTKRPEMINSAQWAELYNEASGTNYYSPEVIQKYRDHSDPDLYPDVDWFDALFDDMAENQRVNECDWWW